MASVTTNAVGGDLKNTKVLYPVSSVELAPEDGPALHTEHSPHWALWEKASVLWRVPLVIQGLPGGTAKKDKRSHGQASNQHKMFCAAAGWIGIRAVPSPIEVF